MAGSDCRHPLFARIYLRLAPAADAAGAREHRRRLLEGLTGRVVEVGAGSGANFAHYPTAVTEVVAVEPEPTLRAAAERAATDAPVPIHVVDGLADHLPLEDASCDAAVTALVLCSVPNPVRALTEVRRVLRPGGELRVYEHVRGEEPRRQRVQRALEPAWRRVAGGCHLTRDTVANVRAAGFVVDDVDRFLFSPSPVAYPVAPHVLARAHRP